YSTTHWPSALPVNSSDTATTTWHCPEQWTAAFSLLSPSASEEHWPLRLTVCDRTLPARVRWHWPSAWTSSASVSRDAAARFVCPVNLILFSSLMPTPTSGKPCQV